MEGKSGYLMERYELGRLLGQGTFAKVYFARNLKTNQSVAVKIIDKEKCMRVGLMNMVKREISVLHKVRHPNIVYLYEVMATRTKIYFVMEYAKGGELFDKVSEGGRLREDVAHKYFQQLIHAVDFCHSRGIYHRDIKLENLLLDANGDLKVTDFGLCALAESRKQDGLLHTACGTPSYVAPEVILQKGYDGAKSDVWSCGVVLFVLLAGYPPFYDRHLLELYRKIDKAEFKFPKWFPQDVRQLLLKILNPNPESRISMAKIKESSWFQKEFTSKSHVTDAKAKGKSVGSSYGGVDTEVDEESISPAQLNAFDIITLSRRFDLSGLFEGSDKRKETRFSSRQPAPVIVSRLLETAKHLRFRIRQIAKGVLNFEASSAGRKGPVSIDAEIFEVTPAVFLVELRKSDGDTLEYRKAIKEDIRPALKDIVWTWQGEKQQC